MFWWFWFPSFKVVTTTGGVWYTNLDLLGKQKTWRWAIIAWTDIFLQKQQHSGEHSGERFQINLAWLEFWWDLSILCDKYPSPSHNCLQVTSIVFHTGQRFYFSCSQMLATRDARFGLIYFMQPGALTSCLLAPGIPLPFRAYGQPLVSNVLTTTQWELHQ